MMMRVLMITALAVSVAGCSSEESKSNQPKPVPTGNKKPLDPAPTQPTSGTAKKAQAGSAQAGDDPALAKARQIFQTQCAMCHGPEGKGNGPAAANLPAKPRNYSDPKWQASVTDDRIKQVIVQGGAASGLSAIMPANPQLANMPDVLDGLVKLIRSFEK